MRERSTTKQLLLAPLEGNRPVEAFWLTPPELWEELHSRFGELYDPAPYPCPKSFDGLKAKWPLGSTVYCNPPFKSSVSAWARRCIEHGQSGGRSLFIVATFWNWPILAMLRAGASYELRAIRFMNPKGERRPEGKEQSCLLFGLGVDVRAKGDR